MVKKQTPFNKALVQNWDTLAAMDDEEPLLRAISQRKIAALVAMCEYLAWQTRYDNPPSQDIADDFSAQTEFDLTNPIEICARMIECIENDSDVRAALAQWFSDAVDNDTVVQQALQRAFDPGKGGSQIPDEYANQNQYGAALGCDNDDGWGHIRDGLIERSFQRVIDVLERIEFVTDNQEMLAEFVNAIPGVGAFFDVIPVTDWILWFDNVRATLKEAFEAGDTTDLRDQIACDLFCIWQENCSLSVEQIRNYYWTKTVEILPSFEGAFESFAALGAALSAFTTVSVPVQAVYALVGSQYGFLTFVNDWFGVHINATANDLALGEPSDDWIALCDDCPTFFSHRFDFEIDEQGWAAFGSYAQYTPLSGWFEDTPGIIWIYITIPDSGRKVTSVEFEVATGNQILAQVGTPADCSSGFVSQTESSGYNFATIDLTAVTGFGGVITEIAVRVAVDGFVPVTGAITAVTLNGDGADPF